MRNGRDVTLAQYQETQQVAYRVPLRPLEVAVGNLPRRFFNVNHQRRCSVGYRPFKRAG